MRPVGTTRTFRLTRGPSTPTSRAATRPRRLRALATCCVGALAGLGLLSCASLPRPKIVTQAEQTAETPAAKEAEKFAPQAHAHAIKLRQQADEAYRAGDLAGAQILGEHAIAAMTRAFVLTRLVKAQTRLDEASAKLTEAQQKLAKLDEQAERITAEADNLELQVKVARDAEPLAENSPASPEREKARRSAARALASQARLLCLATRMLDPEQKKVRGLLAKLDTLDGQLKSDASVDIKAATKARSECLRELTLVRRPQTRRAPAQGLADALLEQLTKTERFFAFRDDRGVVVVLRELFDTKGQLSDSARKQLTSLGSVAKAHVRFPLLVVSHQASHKASDGAVAQVVQALRDAGASAVDGHSAGNALPVANPTRAGAKARNDRFEVIFVSPAP